MTEMKIVGIKLKPWWKFWRIANLEVTLEDNKGHRKVVRVHKILESYSSIDKKVFMDFVGYKYCTGNQLWDFERRMKKKVEKERPSKDMVLNQYVSELVGKSFDCVDLMSREEE